MVTVLLFAATAGVFIDAATCESSVDLLRETTILSATIAGIIEETKQRFLSYLPFKTIGS